MDAVAAGLEWVRDAAGRAWSLSEGELRDAVVELARVRSRAEAAYLAVVKVLDDRPEAVPGAPLDRAGAVFLQERVHLDPARANADVRAAHTLDPDTGTLPEVGAALAAGDITREHADVCVRAAAKLPKRLHLVTVVDEATGQAVLGMTAVDRWLAEQARRHQVRSIRQLTEQLVAMLDPDRREDFDADAHLRRSIRLGIDATGMGLLSVTMTPTDAATLKATLTAMAKPLPATEAVTLDADGNEQTTLVRDERTLTQRTYDAFIRLVRGDGPSSPVNLLVTATAEQVAAAAAAMATRTGSNAGPAGHAPGDDGDGDATQGTVSAHGRTASGAGGPVPASFTAAGPDDGQGRHGPPGWGPGLARLDRYGSVGSFLLGYLACTPTLSRVLLDGHGVPLGVGRAHRLATPAQRRALAVRDGGCVVPGCGCPADGADAHHVTAWSAGGGTALTNLVLLCPRHHQLVHAGILDVKIHDGRAWVRLPAWMDRSRPWVRNLLHTAHHEADRIGQQLRLALDTHDPTRDGRRQHRIEPIDLRRWWNRPTSTDPPHDDRHFGAA